MARARKRHVQLTFADARKPEGHGGWRPKAGRPRGRKTVPHDARPPHKQRFPIHVTLRLRTDVPPIASEWLMKTIREGIRDSQKTGFSVVEFNILSNHLHFICEADSDVARSRGMQGLAGRLAKRINRRLKRRGKVFATRFHYRSLETPQDVRNTLRYVMLNRKHHAPDANFDRYWVDPFSSGPWFTGWAEPIRRPDTRALAALPSPTRPARTWLLSVGWRRHGAIRFDDRPRG